MSVKLQVVALPFHLGIVFMDGMLEVMAYSISYFLMTCLYGRLCVGHAKMVFGYLTMEEQEVRTNPME